MRRLAIVLSLWCFVPRPLASLEMCGYGFFTHNCQYTTEADVVGFNTDPAEEPCGFSLGGCPRITLSISASDSDPNVNNGPLLKDDLFLWLICVEAGYGYGFSDTRVALETDMDIVGYEVINGAGAFLSLENLILWIDPRTPCREPVYPQLLGRFDLKLPTSIEMGSWGRIKALYRGASN